MMFFALLYNGISVNRNVDFFEVFWVFVFIVFVFVLVVLGPPILTCGLVELFALLLKLFFQIFLLLTRESLETWLHFG